jgi:iron complex transport system ATP-binding protein
MNLEARALAFGYPGKPVGHGVDLTVAPGDALCLLGPNGAGKTTLFKTLLGLLPPLGGEIRIGGAPLKRLSRREIAQRIAYIPQAHTPPFPFAVRDVVLMGRTARLGPFESPGRADRDAAERALDLLGIAALAYADYTRISGGQRQLALIARALAQETPLLVMDEPTASLDFGNQALVLRQIRRLVDRGFGLVLSTHDPDHAFACATRVMLLHDGGALAEGTPEDVLTPDHMRRLYGVTVTIERLADGRTVCAPSLADPDPCHGPL